MRKAILVYNPKGGNKKAQRLLDTLVSPLLREADFQVEIVATTHRGHGDLRANPCSADSTFAAYLNGSDPLFDASEIFLTQPKKSAAPPSSTKSTHSW